MEIFLEVVLTFFGDVLALLTACQAAPTHLLDGGECGLPLSDGGFTRSDPHEHACENVGDTCRVSVADDRCTTSCACGSDGGWSCARQCPPFEPCRPQGYCFSMSTVCQTDDAGCSLVCHCANSNVFGCTTECR